MPGLERWIEVLDGREALERRLKLAGASPDPAPLLVRSGHSDSLESEAWFSFLRRGFSATGPSTTSDRDYPFGDILAPVVSQAFELLRHSMESHSLWFAPSAFECFRRQLLAHLTFIASLALLERFDLFRFARSPLFAFEDAWLQSSASKDLYAAFLAEMSEHGLSRLLHENPVLARLISQSSLQWLSNVESLCSRFVADLPHLQNAFGWPRDPESGRVAFVHCDLSDRHDGGQTVLELIAANGTRIFYKPRSMDGEWAFDAFVRSVFHGQPKIRTIKVLRRPGYGWSEAVAPSPCSSSSEIEQYYRKAGLLLSVFHLLLTTDMHFENLIAAGPDPVAVDLETILSGWFSASGSWNVLNTGFLPRLRTSSGGAKYDQSGLAAGKTQRAGIGRRQWLDMNTDRMRLSEACAVAPGLSHRPHLNDEPAEASNFLGPLRDGFEEGYEVLLSAKRKLLENDSSLAMFDALSLRIMLRSTETYTSLQLRLLHPEFLANAVDRSIELEWLARPLTAPGAAPVRQRIYELERKAMEQLDVPRFTTESSRVLGPKSPTPDVEEKFLRWPRNSDTVRRQLECLSPDDRRLQLELIDRSFAALHSGAEL